MQGTYSVSPGSQWETSDNVERMPCYDGWEVLSQNGWEVLSGDIYTMLGIRQEGSELEMLEREGKGEDISRDKRRMLMFIFKAQL